jgi:F-type H+-transporting ATPase subunit epsilon
MAADKIKVEVVTPASAVLDVKASQVVLPGIQGELGVLPGHLPLLTALDIGEMVVHTEQGARRFVLEGGFAEILRTKVTILTESCQGVDELDIEHARSLKTKAEESIAELELLSKTEPIEEDALEHHRKQLKLAQTQLLHAKD